MKRKKILFYSLLVSILVIIELFLYTYNATYSSNSFAKYTNNLWKTWLLEDTLSMHYSVAAPQQYGIHNYTPKLPVYTANSLSIQALELENQLYALKKISNNNLTDDQQLTYSLLSNYLQNQLTLSQYKYYEEPLSPSSGAQSQLPILLAEYDFRTKEDVSDYLTLLSLVDNYFEGIIQYEKEKSAAGLFMSQEAAGKIITQCDTIINSQQLKNNEHFLQITFLQRIDSLLSKDIITAQEKEQYLAENNKLLLQVILPAYENLGNSIYLLKDTGTGKNGLFYDPEGANYYEALLYQTTGSNKTPEELMALLSSTFANDYSQLSSFAKKLDASDNSSILYESPVLSIESPEEMIAHLQTQMENTFPPFKTTTTSPSYEIKKVNPSLEDFVAPAFYLTPPLDNITKNSIYINYKNNPDSLSLYTTLGHEGYPGHLYQTVYSQLNSTEINRSPIRSLLYFGGYTEGWALYVENMCYGYASSLINNKNYCEFYRLDRTLQLCLFSMLDISIHYYGLTYEDARNVLVDFGITDEDTITGIYEYIVEEPATYLKYYIGYLEILECKNLAQSLWQENYSDLLFHTFFLDLGPCDFETIKKNIRPKS